MMFWKLINFPKSIFVSKDISVTEKSNGKFAVTANGVTLASR